MRILVVEDESELADVLVEALEGERYAVDLASDAAGAEELVAVNPYDLVVLDWGIPGRPGIDLLREWRQAGVQTPVLMLTGRGQPEDRVGGLDTGADDYLVKPFSFPELLARVRSLLRRRERALQPFRAGDLELDPVTRQVTVEGEPVELSPKEFTVLAYLLSRIDQPVTRTELTEHAWDDSFDAMSNVVDVIVHRLRKKIDGDRPAGLLHTVKGVGYVLRSSRS
jgi:two-component system, OmpR family, response regulator